MEIVLEIPKDLNRLCRTCMNLIDDESGNFNIFETKQTDLCKMLRSITSLKISVEDELPANLCSQCVSQLTLAYTFINQCTEADNNLRKLLYDTVSLDNTATGISHSSTCLKNIPVDLLSCKICENTFPAYYELSMHMIIHNENKNLTERFISNSPDTKCFASSQHKTEEVKPLNKKNSQIYLNNKHNTNKKIEKGHFRSGTKNGENHLACETCQETFPCETDFSNHVRSCKSSNNINTKCTLCEKDFEDLSRLSLHFLNHSLAVQDNDSIFSYTFFCEYCGQIFDSDLALCKHYEENHKNELNWQCCICEEAFDREKELLTHNAIMHLDELMYETHYVDKINCVLCSEKFTTKTELHNHSLAHVLKRYTCRTCSLSFCTQHAYFAHREVHAGRKHVCSVCGKYLSSSSALKYHIEGVHSVELQHCCSICGKRFATLTRLSTHSKIHTSEKKYVCSYCGYSSHKSGDLAMHTRIHTSERPYKCTVPNCTMSFKTSSHLCHHVRRHFQIRKFKCNVCTMKFSTNHGLKIHQMLHTGEKPHMCIVCKKTFRRKYHLKIHMKQHNGQ